MEGNMISYNPLWKLLIDLNKKKTDLIIDCKLNKRTIADMGKNKYVSLQTIEKICNAYNCNIGDIIEYIPKN